MSSCHGHRGARQKAPGAAAIRYAIFKLSRYRPYRPRRARPRQGRAESIETSSLHLDVLRDLKRIHSHICSVAYPVLEAAGELQPSRLKATRAALPMHDVPDEAPPAPTR